MREAGTEWDYYNGSNDGLRNEMVEYISDEENAFALIPELKSASESHKKLLQCDMQIGVKLQVPIITGEESYKRIHGWWDAVIYASGSQYCILILPYITSVERILRQAKAYRAMDEERRNAIVCVMTMEERYSDILAREGIKLLVYRREKGCER